MRLGMAIDLKRCVGCNACTVACKSENGTPPGSFWTRVLEWEIGSYPNATRMFVPARCNHCGAPPCVEVCPSGASHKREQDGIVLVDYDQCLGCAACVAACPYQARSIAHTERYYFGDQPTTLEAENPRRPPVGVAQKCTFCAHRLDEGQDPACVQTCLTRAITIGDLDDATSPISRLIMERRGRQPRSELGTDPALYYLY